jgi:hypothetical protein
VCLFRINTKTNDSGKGEGTPVLTSKAGTPNRGNPEDQHDCVPGWGPCDEAERVGVGRGVRLCISPKEAVESTLEQGKIEMSADR